MFLQRPISGLLFLLAAAAAAPSPAAVSSDLWLLFQNDLDWPTVAQHPSTILLGAHTHFDAVTACAKLNEALTPTNNALFGSDIAKLLSYVSFETGNAHSQKYWVGGSERCLAWSSTGLSPAPCSQKLPALCANSAPYKVSNQTDLSPTWQVQVNSGKFAITGTRDHLSFRFLGIPYADMPERWTYSSLFSGPSSISALEYGSACAQPGNPPTGAEDCLFLNIFTPFLPGPAPTGSKLKPVMFWIHGGGFTNGESSDAIFDGGNLASRADVVVVSFNYRLGALGFLALNDGVTNGNFGLGDQITALKWVRQHIVSFGGDPNRITIFGQSAGAGSVRALLGAPPAVGLFAGAIAESNLGGFAYGHTYSQYFTIEEEIAVAAGAFLGEVGCANGTKEEVLACLRAVPWQTLQNAAHAPRYPVVDGTILVRDKLSVDGKGPVNSQAHVMFGRMAGDGVDFAGSFPQPGITQLASVVGIGIDANLAQKALDSDLFPFSSSGNATLDIFNVTGRIANDGEFLCIDQATAFSAAKHKVFRSMWTYQFERSYMGYEPIPGLCDPPATKSHPFGDPSLPYFQCHSGELYYHFGTLGQDARPFRDALDLPFSQLILDSWASFARTYNPNPSPAFLAARGYATTASALRDWGAWREVGSDEPVRILAWPSRGSDWLEREQCEVLWFPLDFYED
ncbi:Cholinesterase [Mycena kentingensis (nom. inval.)]|nr:Cholinesterase [Mycena kentingensis (nom. inval.)]